MPPSAAPPPCQESSTVEEEVTSRVTAEGLDREVGIEKSVFNSYVFWQATESTRREEKMQNIFFMIDYQLGFCSRFLFISLSFCGIGQR